MGDSGLISYHRKKACDENCERTLKCSAGFPEVDGKSAGTMREMAE